MSTTCVVGKFLGIDKYELNGADNIVESVQYLLEEHRTDSDVVVLARSIAADEGS
jgi:hypothetical protein